MACHVGRASAGGLHSPSFAVGFCTGRPHADVLTVMTCHTIITMTDRQIGAIGTILYNFLFIFLFPQLMYFIPYGYYSPQCLCTYYDNASRGNYNLLCVTRLFHVQTMSSNQNCYSIFG